MRKLEWTIQGKGDDIVLLHGIGMNSAVWQPVVDVLSQHYKVHTVDLLGHGVHHDILVNDLNNMCEQLLVDAPKNAVYIGGLTAMNIAIHHPERVKKLITVAAPPKFYGNRSYKRTLPTLARLFNSQSQRICKLTIHAFMLIQSIGQKASHKEMTQLKQQILSQPIPSKEGLLTAINILDKADLSQPFGQLKMPLLCLYGRLDMFVYKFKAKQVLKIAPKSESYVFKSSNHSPFLSETDLFCEKVMAFIEG